jgi:hypothetical protein
MDTDVQEVAARKDLGRFTFEEILPELTLAHELAAFLCALPFEKLDTQTLDSLNAQWGKYTAALNQLKAFDITVSQPESIRADRQHQLVQALSGIKGATQPVLALLMLIDVDTPKFVKRLFQLDEHFKSQKAELDKFVGAGKDLAAGKAVAKFGDMFKTDADSHEGDSKRWIISTIGFGIVTIIVAQLAFVKWPAEIPAKATAWVLVQPILWRLVTVSLLYPACWWSFRMYRAHRHLAVVNKHRQSALEVFEAARASGIDERAKEQVLLEATRCIFGPTATGFFGGDAAPLATPVEVLQRAASQLTGA